MAPLNYTFSFPEYFHTSNLLLAGILLIYGVSCTTDDVIDRPLPEDLAPYFTPPAEFTVDYGVYRSPLLFKSGEKVRDKNDWEIRRREILEKWHQKMGNWPDVIENPEVNYIASEQRKDFTQHKLEIEVAPGWMRDAYLLVPDLEGPLPAALVVFYDAETSAGLRRKHRDFGYQLTKRGFVTLSFGSDPAENYYPDSESATLQPLSMLAYMAANSYHILANLPEVDSERIGITGFSYGSKWAMFASSFYDKFALGVWNDGGIVFDETRKDINYWEPWYLGYEEGLGDDRYRGFERGLRIDYPSDDHPRTGPYKQMIDEEWNLHELHALMAPRPILVSGGSEDPPERWKALNHTVKVNRLLGYENRVAMHNREEHAPNQESNDVIYQFFEHFLK